MAEKNRIILFNENYLTRVDLYLSNKLELSRSRISTLINSGNILVNNKKVKASKILKFNDEIIVNIPPVRAIKITPIKGELDILYEDSDILALSKPPNLVVHHGAGTKEPTLVNHLLYHIKNLSGIGGELRPGIVHRLDKETSGVMLIAKNDKAHISLSNQFSKRKIKKKYLAIVNFKMTNNKGLIEKKIGRDRKDRKKISINSSSLRNAISKWKVISSFNNYSFLEIEPETGRTHQIRVHLNLIGHPIIGDKIYSTTRSIRNSKSLKNFFSRHMLHANQIKFFHPSKKKSIIIKSKLPEDFKILLKEIKKNEN